MPTITVTFKDTITAEHPIETGKSLTIGKHLLMFAYGEGASRTDLSAAGLDKTMVMDTDQYHDMVQNSELQARNAGSHVVAALSFLSGGSGEVGISKKLFKIGKTPKTIFRLQDYGWDKPPPRSVNVQAVII
ncbi:MAG: hypothetical protein RBT11_01405 [Desulfobacterales bacterium]|jgi:hypothetical protein|nr:hypothetical protein [Desulfobacterales bacterium]